MFALSVLHGLVNQSHTWNGEFCIPQVYTEQRSAVEKFGVLWRTWVGFRVRPLTIPNVPFKITSAVNFGVKIGEF